MLRIRLSVWNMAIKIRNAKHTEANISNLTCHACTETGYVADALL